MSTSIVPVPAAVHNTAPVTWRDLDACKGDYNKLGILSPVIESKGELTPWYDMSLLVPHEKIRFNLLLLERSVQPEYFQANRSWKVKRFFKWYNERFAPDLHHHHHIEDEIYFPYMKSKQIDLPAELTEQHNQMDTEMDNIAKMEQKIKATVDETLLKVYAEELRKSIVEICKFVWDHLSLEESRVPSQLRDKSTQADEAAIVATIVKNTTSAEHQTMMPAIVAGLTRAGGPALGQKFLNGLPVPVRLLYRNFWKSQWEVEHVEYISSICIDSDSEPSLKKSRGCGSMSYYK